VAGDGGTSTLSKQEKSEGIKRSEGTETTKLTLGTLSTNRGGKKKGRIRYERKNSRSKRTG